MSSRSDAAVVTSLLVGRSAARLIISPMRKILLPVFCVMIAATISMPVGGAQKGEPKKAAAKKKPAKIEKLSCRLGTEDEHARIAVLLADGKVENFAYYSKWKPRTCSMDVKRNDAFSKWVDTGDTTVVTLVEDKGAFLIDHNPGRYHFIFRDIDRMRYCGMEGKVNGSLTIWKGKPQCEVSGVMDREEPPVAAVGKPEATPSAAGKPVAKEPEKAAETKAVEPQAAEPKAAESAAPVAAQPAPAVATQPTPPIATQPAGEPATQAPLTEPVSRPLEKPAEPPASPAKPN
jgi:hypothetical protein